MALVVHVGGCTGDDTSGMGTSTGDTTTAAVTGVTTGGGGGSTADADGSLVSTTGPGETGTSGPDGTDADSDGTDSDSGSTGGTTGERPRFDCNFTAAVDIGPEPLAEMDVIGSPAVALDGSGNAVVVLTGIDEGTGVFANRFDGTTGTWVGVEEVGPVIPGDPAQFPYVGMDAAGNATATWHIGDEENYSARFDAAAGAWSAAQGEAFHADLFSASYGVVAVDASGRGTVVWRETGTLERHIVAQRHDAGGLWEPSELVATLEAPSGAIVGTDDNGDVTVVWTSNIDGVPRLVSSRFTLAEGWSELELLDGGDGEPRVGRIAVAPGGDTVVAWQNEVNGLRTVWATRRPGGGDWGAPVQIEPANVENFRLSLGIDGEGNAIAAWLIDRGVTRAYFARYDTVTDSWGEPTAVGGDAPIEAQVAVNMAAGGNAVIVWEQREVQPGTGSVWAKCYDASEGQWSDNVMLDGSDLSFTAPTVAVDDTGQAVAVWQTGIPLGGARTARAATLQ